MQETAQIQRQTAQLPATDSQQLPGPVVTKGSVWIKEVDNLLFVMIPSEDGAAIDGKQYGAKAIQIAIRKETGEFYQLDTSSYVSGEGRAVKLWPAEAEKAKAVQS